MCLAGYDFTMSHIIMICIVYNGSVCTEWSRVYDNERFLWPTSCTILSRIPYMTTLNLDNFTLTESLLCCGCFVKTAVVTTVYSAIVMFFFL